jgi:hypothetical protein
MKQWIERLLVSTILPSVSLTESWTEEKTTGLQFLFILLNIFLSVPRDRILSFIS